MTSLLMANLSATIDIVALALLFILALSGLMQGFTKTFFSLFGTAIALILAIIISPSIVNFLEDKFYAVSEMANNVSVPITNIFGSKLMQTKLSEATVGYLNNAGIGGALLNIILSVKDKSSVSGNVTISEVICPTIAYYIVLIISVVVLFIILKILFRTISKIVKKLYKSKTVARVDRILGLALGILHAIIVSELIILIISVLPLTFTQELYAGIQASSVAKFLEDINLLGLLTDRIINSNIIDTVLKML